MFPSFQTVDAMIKRTLNSEVSHLFFLPDPWFLPNLNSELKILFHQVFVKVNWRGQDEDCPMSAELSFANYVMFLWF
jgi:hypothetical protein